MRIDPHGHLKEKWSKACPPNRANDTSIQYGNVSSPPDMGGRLSKRSKQARGPYHTIEEG
jgi:hypothetical protein